MLRIFKYAQNNGQTIYKSQEDDHHNFVSVQSFKFYDKNENNHFNLGLFKVTNKKFKLRLNYDLINNNFHLEDNMILKINDDYHLVSIYQKDRFIKYFDNHTLSFLSFDDMLRIESEMLGR